MTTETVVYNLRAEIAVCVGRDRGCFHTVTEVERDLALLNGFTVGSVRRSSPCRVFKNTRVEEYTDGTIADHSTAENNETNEQTVTTKPHVPRSQRLTHEWPYSGSARTETSIPSTQRPLHHISSRCSREIISPGVRYISALPFCNVTDNSCIAQRTKAPLEMQPLPVIERCTAN